MQQSRTIGAEVNQCMSGDRSNQRVGVFIAYLYLNSQNISERIKAHAGTGIKAKEHRGPATEGRLGEREE